jgi:hypothetical protein
MINIHNWLFAMVDYFTFYGSKKSGGDGGAAARQAAEDARVADAIRKVNEVFGLSDPTPEPVDMNAFMRQYTVQGSGFPQASETTGALPNRIVNGQFQAGGFLPGGNINALRSFFDGSAYQSAVEASKAKAESLKGAAQKRETLYGKIAEDAKGTALLDLSKDRKDTERELGFMLARQGLTGGSRDIDVNREILDTNQQGILKASNLGLSIANDARSSDDKTRVSLINSIRAGLDQGSAQQQAYEGMRNNANAASDAAKGASLAGFFDTLRQRQQQAAYQGGFTEAATPKPAGPSNKIAGKGYGGNVISA